MLLEDLRIAPAPGAIELGDDDPAVLEEGLEDAVLVGVQLQHPAVAAQADAVERIEHRGRRQVGVGRGRAAFVGGLVVHDGSRLRARRLNAAIARPTRLAGSTTTAPPSSRRRPGPDGRDRSARRAGCAFRCGRRPRRRARGGGRCGYSLTLKPSCRLSGAKNESWKRDESCQRARALRPSRGHRARQRVARLVQVGRRREPVGVRVPAVALGTSNCSSPAEGRLSIGQRR